MGSEMCIRDRILTKTLRNKKMIWNNSEKRMDLIKMSNSYVTAPIGKRLTAQFIDECIAFGFGYLFLTLINLATGNESFSIFALFTVVFGYTLLADGLFSGQSFGKKIQGLYVVTNDSEEPCTYLRSVCRNLTYLLGLFDLLPLLGRSKRRVGDFLANTKVVVRID